jgi:aryl-alcohol dehydrogenase-like predicted oxidoreductase
VGVLVYSSLMRGVLTGKFKGDETFDDLRGNDPMFKGEAFRSMIAKVEKLRPMAEAKGCTMTQLSLAATLMHPSIHCAITGIKSPEQIRDCAGAADVQISREEYHAIRATLS